MTTKVAEIRKKYLTRKKMRSAYSKTEKYRKKYETKYNLSTFYDMDE